jgi:hypothetical protein
MSIWSDPVDTLLPGTLPLLPASITPESQIRRMRIAGLWHEFDAPMAEGESAELYWLNQVGIARLLPN